MWFLKLKIHDNYYWAFTSPHNNRELYTCPDALFAEAFDAVKLEYVKGLAAWLIPNAVAIPVPCNSSKLLTHQMLRSLKLEK